MTKRKQCCGSSVGLRIRRQTPTGWEYALIGRGWWPIGQAPVAGHVYDQHADPIDAANTEALEEIGVTLAGTPVLLWEGHLPNLCQSPPAEPTPGHYWWLYDATAQGELRPDPHETTGAAWVGADRLRELANVTIGHARSGAPARDLPAEALEAVWVELFARAGDLAVSDDDRAAVRRLYSTAPDEYWIG